LLETLVSGTIKFPRTLGIKIGDFHSFVNLSSAYCKSDIICLFLIKRLENGKRVKLFIVMDEFTRESLTIDVAWSFSGRDVVEL
jgi:hypothetical protein